jgi:hypothetical protein
MKKINIIAVFFLTQAAFANIHKSSHPIYFNGGNVPPHESVSFDLPYYQMSAGVLYDISCIMMGNDSSLHQPILHIKITGDPAANSEFYAPTAFINNMKISYPFQDRLLEKTNTLLFHDFSCPSCQPTNAIQLSAYNFDDVETVNFSNCYIIVSKQNA